MCVRLSCDLLTPKIKSVRILVCCVLESEYIPLPKGLQTDMEAKIINVLTISGRLVFGW